MNSSDSVGNVLGQEKCGNLGMALSNFFNPRTCCCHARPKFMQQIDVQQSKHVMNSHHDKLLQEGAQDDEPAQTSIQCTLCPSDSTHCFWTLQMKQQQQQQQNIVTRLKQRIIGLQQTLPAFFLCLIQVQKRLQVANRHRCWVCYLRTTNHFFK